MTYLLTHLGDISAITEQLKKKSDLWRSDYVDAACFPQLSEASPHVSTVAATHSASRWTSVDSPCVLLCFIV